MKDASSPIAFPNRETVVAGGFGCFKSGDMSRIRERRIKKT